MDDYENPTAVMAELFDKLMESIEEIKRTQEQHGRLLQALLQKNNITVDTVEFPPNLKLPFKTVRDLVDGESFWCDEAVAAKLIDTLVELGGQTLRKTIRRIMEYLMTCDVECSLCLMRPSPGKTALKPLKLYDLIQRLVEELFNKLMQSIEEVREMQEEIQKTQKLHGSLLQKLLEKNNISVSDGIEFPPTLTFPFKTVDELSAAELAWGNELLATKLVDTLAKIGGLTLRKAINRMMDHLMSDAVERQLCFVRPTPGKIAFKPLKLYGLIKLEYHDDKRNPDNYVRIGVDIKGLRTKTFGKGAENADVKLECTERSMCLTVLPKGKSSISKYRYEVRQLPGDILTDEKKTYFKVQKDMVEVFLHKASPGLWARQLSSVGLEQDTC